MSIPRRCNEHQQGLEFLPIGVSPIWGKLWTADAPQAVIVATPADYHAATCSTVLDRKLAVLVEKPFTLQLRDAVRLVALGEANSTPLLVAQNYRYLRSFRTVKRMINEGLLGRVGMVVCHYYRPFHCIADSLAKLENSVLWGVSVHHLDALRYVLGSKLINVRR